MFSVFDIATGRPRPVRVGAGALAAGDRLVVGEAVVADGEVVHRSLALRGDRYGLPERAEEDVDDAVARLDVAGGDRRGCLRVDEAASGARTVTGA